MKRTALIVVLGSCSALLPLAGAQDAAWVPLRSKNPDPRPRYDHPTRQYLEAIQRTATMVSNPNAQRLSQRHGLNILNLTWEDTGRYKNSAVGPNISDMTIQVGVEDPRTKQFSVTCMPVIRFPNFSDISTDIDPRDFTLLVGNHKSRSLKRVSLYDFLAEPTKYLTKPESWLGKNRSLLADRDSRVLVSAQACFLPVPRSGLATFNPVLFNYQSVSGDPAVLTILATREGTSTTIIDNKRDAFREGSAWGQRLFHNQGGMRASLTGRRESDFMADPREVKPLPGGGVAKASQGMSMVLLIQVPLKQKHEMRFKDAAPSKMGGVPAESTKKTRSDVEAAVIGHGDLEGPFTEIDNLRIERDPRFPVRVTVQFYKATSNGEVSPQDMREIKSQIDSVYKHGDSVGSLVTGGDTGRVTEYDGCKVQPADWWERFWERHEQNTGDSRWEAIAKLRKLLGHQYMRRPVCDLYLRDILRRG